MLGKIAAQQLEKKRTEKYFVLVKFTTAIKIPGSKKFHEFTTLLSAKLHEVHNFLPTYSLHSLCILPNGRFFICPIRDPNGDDYEEKHDNINRQLLKTYCNNDIQAEILHLPKSHLCEASN